MQLILRLATGSTTEGWVWVPVGSRIFSSPHRPGWFWGPSSLLYNSSPRGKGVHVLSAVAFDWWVSNIQMLSVPFSCCRMWDPGSIGVILGAKTEKKPPCMNFKGMWNICIYTPYEVVSTVSGTDAAICTAVVMQRQTIVLAYLGSQCTKFHTVGWMCWFFMFFYLESCIWPDGILRQIQQRNSKWASNFVQGEKSLICG
jgi:hypothetical protein